MATWRPPFFGSSHRSPTICRAASASALRCSICRRFPCRVPGPPFIRPRGGPASRLPPNSSASAFAAANRSSLQRGPSLRSDDPALIEIERPGDLDLNRVGAVGGRAEMLGDISAGEWLVAPDAITRALEARFKNVDDRGRRARAIAVAEHDIESADIGGVRGHRVAVEQHRDPEPSARALDQRLQFARDRADRASRSGEGRRRPGSVSGRSAARRRPPWESCRARPRPSASGCSRTPAGGHRKSAGRVRRAPGSHRDRREETTPARAARRARRKAKTARRRRRLPSGAGSADRAARRQESAGG